MVVDFDGVAGGLAQEASADDFTGFSQNEMIFDLDFLDESGWNLGLGEVPVFGGGAT
jgi:hypothetical protein